MTTRIAFLAALLLATSWSVCQQFPDHCPNGGKLPFNAPQLAHSVDQTCGLKGKPSSPANSQLQNSVKNNFCSSGATPELNTPAMLIALQKKTPVPSGTGKEPPTRDALRTLGEGKLVRMKASIIEAHHADVGTGESVNCGGKTEEENDIHIALGLQLPTQECASVTAEISPHYRPQSWNEIGHFEIWNPATKKYVVNAAIASRLQAQPLRFTGQLFFDASHELCACGTTCSPSRSSVWEIHPVYKIDVCKSGTQCREDNDGDWLSFDDWWHSLTPVQPTKPPHKHDLHEHDKP